ncbi:cyclic nucleotide-binding domain-containing protein [Candidatus Peregrinibacteria bacterium]|nr:cyclic nucleotide-binding domain-containing protein [Candidatus Peregrinibacteria bacterium]
MMQNKIWYLKQVDLFKGIPEQEIMRLTSSVTEKECQKKEVLYTPLEINNKVYVLKKGEVTLYHLHKGKKLIIDVLKAGSIFGNLNLKESKSSHFAEVTESAYVCIFSIKDFLMILQSSPELMMKLLSELSGKMQGYEDKLKINIYDAKEKVLSETKNYDSKRKFNIIDRFSGKKKKLTHEKLSQLTGLTRETVSRAITELRKEGLVKDDMEKGITIN